MTSPAVSVVMSVYNGERFLREAVESILDQSFREFEFIIVNDGSTDGSAAILNEYQSADARVKVHHEKHAGLVPSLNRGCELAEGKYIARMDADDIAKEDRLISQLNFMECHPEIAVLGGAVEWIDANARSLGTCRYPSEDREIKATQLNDCAVWHPTVLLRKEVFVWAGGYRSVVVDAEDYDLWLRIGERFQLANLNQVVLKYRIHPHQVSLRKRAQQTRGILAAQIAAKRRKDGLPDPLRDIKEIAADTLVGWGVSVSEQRSRFVIDTARWIQNMCMAGEYSTALDAAQEVLQGNVDGIDPMKIADLHLTVAALLWRERRIPRSAVSLAFAILAWPRVAGRPFKRMLKSFSGND